MKQFFFFLLISLSTFGQNVEKVDAKVILYPKFSKAEDLANQINNDFTTDLEKARAAFFWLANNINYNLKEYYSPRQRRYSFRYSSEEEKNQKLQAIKDQLVVDTFKNKLGVCEEYAQSFKKVCDLLNIESEVIKGYVRNDAREIGNIPNKTNHAYNAVKIDDKWLILDATWAAGYENNGKWKRNFNPYFFDIPKDKIFKTHYPEEKIWVLRFGRMSLEEFYNQPIYSNHFLTSDASLLSPKNGIIPISSSNDILLKINNLEPITNVFYIVEGSRYFQKPLLSLENNTTVLSIKNPNRTGSLIVYINNKDALHFKLVKN